MRSNMVMHRSGIGLATLALLAVGCAANPRPYPPPAASPTAVVAAAQPTAAVATAALVAAVPTATAKPPTPATATALPTLIVPAASPTPAVVPTPLAPTARSGVVPDLIRVVDGLTRPTFVTHAGDGSRRLVVLEQPGRAQVIEGRALRAEPFLDIRDRVGSRANEQGLLGMAFSPDFASGPAPAVYVNYTDGKGNTVVSCFLVDRASFTADPASERKILQIDQPYANHNGGAIAFGPDGMLYIAMGDGGSAGDPQNRAQNPDSLLGKLLRIAVADPACQARYKVPADNPRIGGRTPSEVWALGLRNPWRFSFDRATGDLYIGDVGQNAFEEIDFAPGGGRGGENYGWNLREGFSSFRGGEDNAEFTPPIHHYGRADGCSVTGGYVYRGSALPKLKGKYVYGDYCSGQVWALRRDGTGAWQNEALLDSTARISSFGEDEAGELYLVDHSGAVLKLAPADGS